MDNGWHPGERESVHTLSQTRHPVVPEIGTTVIGGGIVGLCTAWFLAREGADVACVDDGRHAGSNTNAGSLHVQMQSRLIRLFPHLVPAIEQALPLYVLAVRHWCDTARQLDDDIDLQVSGGLMVAETAEQLRFLEKKCQRERELGLEVEILDGPAVHKLASYLRPSVVGAEYCATEGKVDPLRANSAVRRQAVRSGAVHLADTLVHRLDHGDAMFCVHTDKGVIRTGRIVLAAGAGSAGLAADLGLYLPAEAEPLHMNITERTAPLMTHLLQHSERPITMKQLSSGHVIIGGGWPARLTPREKPPEVTHDSLIGNVSLAYHLVPEVGPLRLLRTWAGVNTTLDGCSALGQLEGMPGLFIAIPGDAGYTLGPLCARLVTDDILGRAPEVDMKPFSPTRFAYSGMAKEIR